MIKRKAKINPLLLYRKLPNKKRISISISLDPKIPRKSLIAMMCKRRRLLMGVDPWEHRQSSNLQCLLKWRAKLPQRIGKLFRVLDLLCGKLIFNNKKPKRKVMKTMATVKILMNSKNQWEIQGKMKQHQANKSMKKMMMKIILMTYRVYQKMNHYLLMILKLRQPDSLRNSSVCYWVRLGKMAVLLWTINLMRKTSKISSLSIWNLRSQNP